MNKANSSRITSNKVDSTRVDSTKKSSTKKSSNKYNIANDNYIRPELTYTDKLSKEQIKTLLLDYELINNVSELYTVPPGTHLRYFENKNGELKFRTGGILTVTKGLPDYLILNSGKVSWSVQVKNCVFYKRITISQVKEEFNKVILEKNAVISGLEKLLKEQDKELKEYKKMLKSLKK